MKYYDLRSLPQNQYLSKFLAAKYLGISVFDFEAFVEKHNINTYHIDKFGEKFKISELLDISNSLSEDPDFVSMPESSKGTGEKVISTDEIQESQSKVINFTIQIARIIEKIGHYVLVPRYEIAYYKSTPLYHKGKDGSFVLYKPSGKGLSKERIHDYRCPPLYYHDEDRTSAVKELIEKYNAELEEFIKLKSVNNIQKVMVDIFTNSLLNPDPEVLVKLKESVTKIIENHVQGVDTLDLMCNVVGVDQGDAGHAINIMNLAINFCFSNDYTPEATIDIALSALLHDIGKTVLEYPDMNDDGTVANSEENCRMFELHTVKGAELIKSCGFPNEAIQLGALEHHEKLDGSGFPEGKTKLSIYGQLIGMIHFFEAKMESFTSSGKQPKPLTILKLLKEEVDNGKYNAQLFKQFAYSLL